MKRIVIVAAVLVICACTLIGARWLRSSKPNPPSVPSAGGASNLSVESGKYPYYLQGDPAWGQVTIGGSNETLAAVGCTVCCIAMGLTGLGHPMTPDQVCESLKANGGFTDNGHVIWGKVGDLTDGSVEMATVETDLNQIDRELTAGRPVMVKVMLGDRFQHWVLVVSKDGQEYLAIESLNQSRQLVPVSSLSDTIESVRVFKPRSIG